MVQPVRTRELVEKVVAPRYLSQAPLCDDAVNMLIHELQLTGNQVEQLAQAYIDFDRGLQDCLSERASCSQSLMQLTPDLESTTPNASIFLQVRTGPLYAYCVPAAC